MTIHILPEFALAFALVFARIGTMMMLMPGLSERAAPARVRLALALLVSLTALPLIRSGLPRSTANTPAVLAILFGELAIGFTFGLAMRFITASLQVAGVLISQQIGVSFAMSIDPVHGDQGQAVVLSSFLMLLGVALIFATNLHHVALMGIFDSYNSFKPGELPKSGDAAELILMIVHGAFKTGVQLSAPFLVFGLVFNAGLGILSRMMPQLQVFFLALPAMLLLGVIILILVLSLMMDDFLQQVAATFHDLFPGAR